MDGGTGGPSTITVYANPIVSKIRSDLLSDSGGITIPEPLPDSPWNPSYIDTALWLDASVPSSVVLDGANKVSQWLDLSGNNRHATQTNSTQRPDYSLSEINGLNVIGFTGGNVHLLCNPGWGTYWEWFLVLKFDSTASQQVPIRDNVEPFSTAIIAFSSPSSGFYRSRNTQSPLVTSIASEFGTTVNLSGMISNADNTSTALLNSVNRSTWATTGAMGNALYLGTNGIRLNVGLVGAICEFLITPSPLDLVNRNKAEGYLCHKWGFASKLPSDHPYKTNPPTVFS